MKAESTTQSFNDPEAGSYERETLDSLWAMSVSDVAEIESLMGGMTEESTAFELVSTTDTSRTFSMKFYGVEVARTLLLRNDKGAYKWQSM